MDNITQNKQNNNKQTQQDQKDLTKQQEQLNNLKQQNRDLQKRIGKCVSRKTYQQNMNEDLRKLEKGINRMMKNYQKKKTMERKEQQKRKMDRQSASNGKVALAQNCSQTSFKKLEELIDSLTEERAFRALLNEEERMNERANLNEFDFEPEEDEKEEEHRYWQEFLYWYEEEDYLMMPRFLFEKYEVESSDEYMVGYNMPWLEPINTEIYGFELINGQMERDMFDLNIDLNKCEEFYSDDIAQAQSGNIIQIVKEIVNGLKSYGGNAYEWLTTKVALVTRLLNGMKTYVSASFNIGMFALQYAEDVLTLVAFIMIYLLFRALNMEFVGRILIMVMSAFGSSEICKFTTIFTAASVSWTLKMKTVHNIMSAQSETESLEQSPIVTVIFVILALVSGMTFLADDAGKYIKFVKNLDAHAKLMRSVKTITSSLGDMFEYVAKQFGITFCGFGENSSTPEELKEIFETLATFNMEKRNQMATNEKICLEVQEMYEKMMTLRKKYISNRIVMAMLDKVQVPVTTLYTKATAFYASSGKNRIEPVVVMMRGESGVGKSSLLYHIGVVVLSELKMIRPEMTDEEINERVKKSIYARMVEQEYWDGFVDQPCTLVDDFGQMKDSQSNPNIEYMELIRMSNTFPYPLHMAGVEQKGLTVFNSKAVIATTNLRTMDPSSLACREAVLRRIDMPLAVSVKREYADEKGRLRNEFKKGVVNLDVYEFEYHNFGNGLSNGAKFGFDEFINRLVSKMKEKATKYHEQSQDLPNFARSFMKKQQQPAEFERVNVPGDGNCFFHAVIGATGNGKTPEMMRKELLASSLLKGCENEKLIRSILEKKSEMVLVDIVKLTALHYGIKIVVKAFFNGKLFEEIPFGEGEEIFLHFENSHYQYYRKVVPAQFFGWLNKIWPKVEYETIDPDIAKILKLLPDRFLSGVYENPPMRDLDQMFAFYYEEGHREGYDTHEMKTAYAFGMMDEVLNFTKFEEEYMSAWDAFKHILVEAENKYKIWTLVVGVISAGFMAATLWTMISPLVQGADYSVDEKFVDEDGVIHVESGKSRKNAKKPRVESGKSRGILRKAKIESGKARKNARKVKVEAEAEAWKNSNTRETAMAIRKNQMEAYFYIDDQQVFMNGAKICFLGGRTFMINKHYINLLEKNANLERAVIKITRPGTIDGIMTMWNNVKGTRKELTRNGTVTDVLVYTLDNKTANYPDISKHVISKSFLSNIEGSRVCMSVSGEDWMYKFGHVDRQMTVQYAAEDRVILSSEGLRSTISSEDGDCGSIYLLDEPSVARKVCGFHFAGMSGKAFAVPLVLEDILKVYSPQKEKLPVFAEAEPTIALANGNLTFYGKVEDAPFVPSKSKIVETEVFNQIYETEMAPACLDQRKQEGLPLVNGIKKQFGSTPVIDEDILDVAIGSYQDMLGKSRVTQDELKVLDFETAVQGIEGSDYFRGINRSKSAGYPWSKESSKGKTHWFGNNEWTLTSEKALEVKQTIEQQIKDMEEGIIQPYIFVDTLKDETRKIEKVEQKKTRVFAAGPMDYLIVFRMYFLGFLAHMMRNRIDNESAVGIKSQSMEWDLLAKHLLSKGNNMVAGDFSNYDGTLHVTILWRILDVIEDFYKAGKDYCEKHAQVRRCLWESTVNAYHLCGNELYKVNHSQPSGNPMTAILNSIYNSIACRYVFYQKGLTDFNGKISMIAYGDDNILSLRNDVKDLFQQEVITDGFKQIGMTYTDEEKTGRTYGYKKLEECFFLQRGFKKDEDIGIWIGPLKISSILECFNWIKETNDEYGVLEGNARMAFAELALHDTKIFNKYSAKIKQALAGAYGQQPYARSQLQYRTWLRSGELTVQIPELNWV